jgi:hypothetical protein
MGHRDVRVILCVIFGASAGAFAAGSGPGWATLAMFALLIYVMVRFDEIGSK